MAARTYVLDTTAPDIDGCKFTPKARHGPGCRDATMNSFGVPWAGGSSGKAKCPYQNRWYDWMICEGQAGRMAGFPLAGEQPAGSR
jgi:hypothetical protein